MLAGGLAAGAVLRAFMAVGVLRALGVKLGMVMGMGMVVLMRMGMLVGMGHPVMGVLMGRSLADRDK